MIALTFERYVGLIHPLYIRGESNERKHAHIYPVMRHLHHNNLVCRFVANQFQLYSVIGIAVIIFFIVFSFVMIHAYVSCHKKVIT